MGRAHKNQHTEMSEFHARGFYAPGAKAFWRFDVTARRWSRSHARKAGGQDDWFTRIRDGQRDLILERWMSQVETHANEALLELRTHLTLTDSVLSRLLWYAALVHPRTPAFEQLVKVRAISSDPVLREWAERSSFLTKDREGNEWLARELRVTTVGLAFTEWWERLKTFSGFKLFVAADDSFFVSSDHPMAFFSDGAEDTMFCLPLAHDLLLSGSRNHPGRGTIHASLDIVAGYNTITMGNAYRSVYSPHAHAKYVANHDGDIACLADGTDLRTALKAFELDSPRPLV